jgi:hypothetical protein
LPDASFDESQAHLCSLPCGDERDELDNVTAKVFLRRAHKATRRARTSPSTFLFLPIQLSNSKYCKQHNSAGDAQTAKRPLPGLSVGWLLARETREKRPRLPLRGGVASEGRL